MSRDSEEEDEERQTGVWLVLCLVGAAQSLATVSLAPRSAPWVPV